jgi:hypothetical protein
VQSRRILQIANTDSKPCIRYCVGKRGQRIGGTQKPDPTYTNNAKQSKPDDEELPALQAMSSSSISAGRN